jgi:hypothetical protein
MVSRPLKEMLARVGEEKARVRRSRSGLLREGAFLNRVEECLELYEELVPLRLSRLVSELGSESSARGKLRAEAEERAHEQEAMLLRIQGRLYGNRA